MVRKGNLIITFAPCIIRTVFFSFFFFKEKGVWPVPLVHSQKKMNSGLLWPYFSFTTYTCELYCRLKEMRGVMSTSWPSPPPPHPSVCMKLFCSFRARNATVLNTKKHSVSSGYRLHKINLVLKSKCGICQQNLQNSLDL